MSFLKRIVIALVLVIAGFSSGSKSLVGAVAKVGDHDAAGGEGSGGTAGGCGVRQEVQKPAQLS